MSFKEKDINTLIHELVVDINMRALAKTHEHSAWTLEDCKKGADFGREIAKIINDKISEMVK